MHVHVFRIDTSLPSAKICHDVSTNISEIVFTTFLLTKNCLESERAFSINRLLENYCVTGMCTVWKCMME